MPSTEPRPIPTVHTDRPAPPSHTDPTPLGELERPEPAADPSPRDPRRPRGDEPRWKLIALALAVAVAAAALGTILRPAPAQPLPVRLSDALELVETDGAVQIADVDEQTRTLQLQMTAAGRDDAVAAAADLAAEAETPAPVAPPEDEELIVVSTFPLSYAGTMTERILEADVTIGAVRPTYPPAYTTVLQGMLPIILILAGAWFLISRQGGNVSKFTGGRGDQVKVPDVRFSAVAGVDEAVDELTDLVAYLHDPARFASSGARPPKGVLLEGPPGTGKTLLARAVAGEAGVPFFALSGSDFVETFVGVGARRVRDLFNKAKKAGTAVVFIDEIDAVGRARGSNNYGNDERENTLNALLVEMDGFESSNVIVIAATNRSDVLDPALLRPGRFDRRVQVPPPDRGGRTRILEVHTANKRLAPDVDLVALARRTPGMTGAELAGLVNGAALVAAKEGRDEITPADFEQSLQTEALGRARTSALVTEFDRTVTAWHEAGHALAALVQPDADDPVAVSIIPRGPAGGATWMSGNDDVFLTRNKAKAQLVTALAGRAAEELLLDGEFTQGAAGDLQSATELAFRMAAQYGMTAHLSAVSGERYAAGGPAAARVDHEVEELLGDAMIAARALVATHRDGLVQLVEWLLVDETVADDRLESLRPPV